MVIQVMKFDGAIPFPKTCPRKNGKTQINHRGIQRIEGVFKLESVFGSNGLALLQKFIENTFKNLIGAVLHGIRQGTALNPFQADMVFV